MRPLPASDVFVGRDTEVARLGELVRGVAAGRGRAVWVEGEPGIGKSSLVAAGLVAADGLACQTAWATADELSQRSPLRVLLDCLGVDFQASDRRRAVLAGALRGKPTTAVAGMPHPVLFAMEGLLALADELSAEAPLIMVIDDLQWADEATLFTWHRLAKLVEQLPLLLIAVCRPVPQREEVDQLRRSVLSRGGVLISVPPLTEGEVAELIGRLDQAPARDDLRRLAANAAGNPLYVRELVHAIRFGEAPAPGGAGQGPADRGPSGQALEFLRRWARALTWEAQGDSGRALDLLVESWSHGMDAMPQAYLYRFCPDLARMGAMAGGPGGMGLIVDTLDEPVDTKAGLSVRASTLLCRGAHSHEPKVLKEAAETYRRAGQCLYTGYAEEQAAVVLAGLGKCDEARTALLAALDLYGGLEAVWDAQRAEARLAEAGVSAGRRSRRSPGKGWDALTDTEREIVAFVAQGCSNPEIGARMFLSHRTVQSYLSNIFRKLGVASRVELAVVAHQRAATSPAPPD